MVWTVYILKCADDTLYTGITNDLKARLQKHTDGSGAKYTRGRGPFKIMRKENYATKSRALKREIEIKRLTRAEKLELIARKKKARRKSSGL